MMGVPFQPFGGNQLSMNGAIGGGTGIGGDNCVRCGFSGCDVRMSGCGCMMHTRCTPLNANGPLSSCPNCNRPTSGITLVPMSFREMDEARKTAAALASHGGGKQGKKRKNSDAPSIDKEKGGDDGDQRTGRWTPAETAYVDELIAKFESGCLPLVDGIKLNDFLAGMLQCKQSRLTKKMKNAKLSSKCFKRTRGYIVDANDAREFSGLEEAFFHSIHCHEERAEIKFHMQKQWRELFSSYCVSLGQPLDADAWLNSVEEIERRASIAKDAARMVRRKLMMGKAYNQDCRNPDRGVIIDRSEAFFNLPADGMKGSSLVSNNAGPVGGAVGVGSSTDNDEFLSLITDKAIMNEINPGGFGTYNNLGPGNSSKNMSPYLEKVITYLQRSSIPFEHVDAWVPSFVPTTGAEGAAAGNPKCRLCFAGCVTAEIQPPKGSRSVPMSTDEHFNLISFGEYSQKFSFDIGCGLPGRVYQSGIPTWEQSVHNAPLEHFERCGGAVQCGIKTVVGIPVPSPNVGRIVVVLYSCHDREKDQELVGRLCEEFTRLLPTPRWKLIVDLGRPSESSQRKENGQNPAQVAQGGSAGSGPDSKDSRVDEVITLLGEHMPSDSSSPLASYLPGFMTLRLLMLRTSRTEQENELVRTMLDSYASYAAAGRSASDIAVLLARDCMFLSQQSSSQTQTLPPPQLSNTASATLPSTSTTQVVASVGQNMNTGSFIHQPAQSQHTGSIAAAPGWHSSGFMQHMPYHSQGNSDGQSSAHPPTLSVDHLSQNKSTNEQSANQSQLRLASQSSSSGADHRNVSE